MRKLAGESSDVSEGIYCRREARGAQGEGEWEEVE